MAAHFAKTIQRVMGQQLGQVEEFLFEDRREDGESKYINAYRIRFASGHQIVGLSSRPENIRGLQGIVVIDEAAFHKDVKAMIDACNALLIWGGKIHIISTHNGQANPFNDLLEKARKGELPYAVHRVTFRDAVRNGLFDRVCMRNGWDPTWPRFRAWIERIYRSYTSKEARDEELFAIPAKGSGVVLTRAMIKRCMSDDYPVLRLALPDGFEQRPAGDREAYVEAWLEQTVDPHLALLDPELKSYFGEDFARSSDLTVLAPAQETRQLRLVVPFMVELRNVPFAQQQQILFHIVHRLPRFMAGAMDGRGNGQALAEAACQEFGYSRIEAVMANDGWYLTHMPDLVAAFEDGAIRLPADDQVETDLRQLRRIDGVIKLPKQRTGAAIAKRHGDAAIAIANLIAAANRDVTEIDAHALGDGRAANDAFADGPADEAGAITGTGFGAVGGDLDFGDY
ncbi:MAG: hypothetical protein ACE5EU_07345 [Paracoccaceae bacterium]